MPPKPKSKLDELRTQQKKEQQQRQEREVKERTTAPPPTTTTARRPTKKSDIDVEEKLDYEARQLFGAISRMNDDLIMSSLRNFQNDSGSSKTLKKIVSTILSKLPQYYIKDFATKFVNQPTDTRDNIQNFWNKYISQPEINELIQKKEEEDAMELREREEEQSRLERIRKQIFPDNDEFPIEPAPDDEIKPLQKQGTIKPDYLQQQKSSKNIVTAQRPIRKKQVFTKQLDNSCASLYRVLPWLDLEVSGVYIASVEQGGDIGPYIIEDKSIERNGEKWYMSNAKYGQLLCSKEGKLREQRGNELIILDKNRNPKLKLKVGYQTSQGFVIQDESIFNKEKEYLVDIERTRQQKLDEILDENVTPIVEKIGMERLSAALHEVAPNVLDYGIYRPIPGYTEEGEMFVPKIDTDYNKKVIELLAKDSTTIREFATKLANIVVYLTIPDLGQDIFKKRIAQEYYLPSVLVELSPEEKLPEYFDDPRTPKSDQERVNNIIQFAVDTFIKSMANSIYNIKHPSERVLPDLLPTFFGDLPPSIEWKSACANRRKVDTIPIEKIVYYKENGKIYCINIDEILVQLWLNDSSIDVDMEPEPILNPATRNPLSNQFLDKIRSKYSTEIREKGYQKFDIPKQLELMAKESVEEQAYEPKEMLAPGLLNMIMENIKEMESEVAGKNIDKLLEEGPQTGYKREVLQKQKEWREERKRKEDEDINAEDLFPDTDESENDSEKDDDSEDGDDSEKDDDSKKDNDEKVPSPPLPPLPSAALLKRGKPSDFSPPSTPTESSDDESSYSPPREIKGDICHYCRKNIDPQNTYKTKLKNNDNFATAHFCSINCFEKLKEPPKPHKRKPKSSKSSTKKSKKNED